MQSTSSTSIIYHFSSAAIASFLRHTAIYHGGPGVGVTIRRSFYLLSGKRENPPNVSTMPHPSKIFHRALFVSALSFDDKPRFFPSVAIGTVAAAQANFMRVIVARDGDDGSSKTGVELVCVVKELMKKMKRIVLVGDEVSVGYIDWTDQRGRIENVFERRSEILDPPVANVDHLLVLFSLDQPKLQPFTLTRFLVEAESTGIPFTLALNKCELVTQEEMEYWRTRLCRWNYEPLFCSVETNVLRSSIARAIEKEKGFKPVLDIKWFESGRQAFVEQGCNPKTKKSGRQIFSPKRPRQKKKEWFDDDQSVGQVSTSNGQGKHTTRNVSLLPVCGGGYLADTPGFNKHKLLKVTKQLLPLCFPEIRKMIKGGKCHFQDCSHIGVEGCVVNDDWERYPYYLNLLDEIRTEEESQLKKYGTKKESDVRYSKVGGMSEKKDVPRLDPKKYKRESRKTAKQRTMAEFD